jgi:phage shock protein C
MKRIYRSRTDRKITGICGGIGEAYGIDPNIVRIVAVFLCFVTGLIPLIAAYIAARLILPEADH